MPPSVTIVIVVFNRRDELRETLRRMLVDSDYEAERLDVVVVDNGSEDGSAGMVRDEYPDVRVIRREENIGAPAWNDGFAVARGDYVLILDDDCYLPPDGLRRAVTAAEERRADMVSFSVISTRDPGWVFSDRYPTGLLSFWGCACLVSRRAIDRLGGYDPELFLWANELEFTIRFYDEGLRHLHLPEVVAQHMKAPDASDDAFDLRGYRVNARNWAYVAGKLLRPREAAGALIALLARSVRNALRADPAAIAGVPLTLRGFARGLRLRRPVRPAVSRLYRRNLHTFVNPLRLARPLGTMDGFIEDRRELYPREAAVLEFDPD